MDVAFWNLFFFIQDKSHVMRDKKKIFILLHASHCATMTFGDTIFNFSATKLRGDMLKKTLPSETALKRLSTYLLLVCYKNYLYQSLLVNSFRVTFQVLTSSWSKFSLLLALSLCSSIFLSISEFSLSSNSFFSNWWQAFSSYLW